MEYLKTIDIFMMNYEKLMHYVFYIKYKGK